jgi:hypothetical protein
MAARRLIIVLLVLFAVSVVAAMIAPERRGPLLGDRSTSSTTDSTTSATSTTSTTGAGSTGPEKPQAPDTLPSGESLTARIDASEKSPQTVEAFVGDQLELVIGSSRAREIEIPAFGVTEDAAPAAPANFNLLLREPGRLPIIDADSGVLLGRLDVREPRGVADKADRGGKSAGKRQD